MAAPSFIGGAARKRKLELAAAKGLLYPGQYNPMNANGGSNGALAPAATPATRAAPAARRGVPAGPTAAAKWIQVGAESAFVAEGLPELAPALAHDEEIKTLMSQAGNIIWDVAGEAAGEIEFKHDAEWADFPEVGEACKTAGCPEEPMCIAVCPSLAKWAVGIAGNWKKREQAAKLSMCVALAANLEDFTKLAQNQPEFTRFCENSGIATDTNLGGGGAAFETPAPKAAKTAQWQKPKAIQSSAPVAAGSIGGGSTLPRDTPVWISVTEELPEQLGAMGPEALAVASDGVKRPGLYKSADKALAALLGDPETSVEYVDDTNWTTMGAVGNALKAIAPSEDSCMCVAICAEKAVWGVGVGNKGKARWGAAKCALASALAMQAEDLGEQIDFSECPSIQEFANEARAAHV